MPRTLSVLLILMEKKQISMFEMLDNLLSFCGVPRLIISVLEVFSCLFCRNHLSTISTQTVSVVIDLKGL